MIKTLQKKLKEMSIIDENEPILSQIQVIDYIKQQQQSKKNKEEIALLLPTKLYNLVTTIKRAENDSTPTIYLFKIEKTNDIKLKLTWHLNEIKTITCLDENQKTSSGPSSIYVFELIFKSDLNSSENNNRYVWRCDTEQDRNQFLNTLWKLSDEFLKACDRPKFNNFNIQNKANDSKNKSKDETVKNDNKASTLGNNTNQYDISKSEEDSLLKLMSECDFASSNAESFMQKLEAELLYLDTSNIESIMNSEENTLKLIEMLDTAVEEIDKIDKRLQTYEEKISAVGDAVRIVGERDNVIQLQQNNQHALLDLLDTMMTIMEFPTDQQMILNECDLSSPKKVERCVSAANQLLDVIEANLPLGLKQMRAYEDQMSVLERLKTKFCLNSYNHLRNVIAHSANKHIETYKIVDNSLHTLPSHKQIHEDLIIFKDLTPWINKSGCFFSESEQKKTYFNEIRENYIETVKQVYLRELMPFCSCAKAKLVKVEKPRATASMENLKGSLIRQKADKNDPFIVKIDLQTKDMLKIVLSKLLNQMSAAVQNEQLFCQEFFNLKQPSYSNNNTADSNSLSIQKFSRTSSSASMLSSSTGSSKQQQNDKSEIAILSQIFNNSIEEQVRSIIDCILRLENMMVMFVYSDLLKRVLDNHNNKSFMHQPLTLLLRTAKEKCDEFINHFKDLIRDYKVVKREKIGILRYVTYFEEFVKESESCWDPIKANMYEKLINIYQIIINEIWKGIETVANESLKTPPEVVRFQNYHQMHHVMRAISNLKEPVKFAKEKYTQSKDQYVKELFGQPLEKLHNFFEKVDAQIQRGCKYEDVQYKLDLSTDKLREIIRDYPAKEVKKGLEALYLKVEKQLVENSSLLEVVWQNMSSEFINQYKYYESLIKACYPGKNQIALEFTEQEICEFFRDIAQNH